MKQLFSVCLFGMFIWGLEVRGGGMVEAETEYTLELGASIHAMIPNSLPGFEEKLIGYGPVVGFPVGTDVIQLQIKRGSDSDITAYLFEVGYRLTARTPFFLGYLIAGPHVLHYSKPEDSFTFFGALLGFGVSVPWSSTFMVNLDLKVYFQKERLITLGGGFVFRL